MKKNGARLRAAGWPWIALAIGVQAFGGAEVIASNGSENHAAAAEASAPAGWLLVAITGLLAAVVMTVAIRRGWLRLPTSAEATAESGRIAPVGPIRPPQTDAALWFAGLFLLQLLAPAIPVGLLQGSIAAETLAGRATLQWLAYAAQIPFAVLIVMRIGGSFAAPLRTAALGAIALALAAPVILAASQVASLLQQLLTSVRPDELGHETLRALIDRRGDPWAWAVIAAVTIGAPILEEIAYRGGLHGLLRSLGIGPWATVLLASIFFVVMHLGMIPRDAAGGALAGLFALSILLGLLRERSGGLIAPIVAHALFNAANLVLAWLLSPSPA
jgi:membrane protease YdiL (CAAX protease family)